MKIQQHTLSKSTFIRGLQCEKNLYLYKYHPELADELSQAQQAIFSHGTSVGVLAQQLFPGGIDCSPPTHFEYDKCLAKTNEAIKNGAKVLYEAGFIFDDVLVICDILVKEGEYWNIYEVKSSTSVSEVYLNDAAVQYYVVKNKLPRLNDISVTYINNTYIRQGELDINQLFISESVKLQAEEKEEFVRENIARLKSVINNKIEPVIDIGTHCNDPYQCSFLGHCWKHIPEYSVFNISRLKEDKKFELYQNGILSINDVPDSFPLSSNQRLQVECEKRGESIIDLEAIREFLSTIEFPIAFIDFETFIPPVPMFDNSRPYQQITFQYSVHLLESENSPLLHKHYLAESDINIDPRIEFINGLLNELRDVKTVLVYNQSFETARLKEIARDFPSYSGKIEEVLNKVIDLMKPFQNKSYYKPEMKGSYSIKRVLPALIPGLSYEGMEISEGGTASSVFENLYYEKDNVKIAKNRADLLEYCKLDTLAMVKIWEFLKGLI